MKNLYYYGFIILEYLLNILPNILLNLLKNMLANLFYYISKKRRNIVYKNLELMTGKKDKILAKKAFYNFFDNIFDILKSYKFTKEDLKNKIEFKNLDQVKELLNETPVIFVTAHYSNWEILPLGVGAFVAPLDVTVRKIDSDKLDKKIKEHRERFGIRIYDRKYGLKYLIKSLKSGRSIGLLLDQYPGDDKGIVTRFFSHPVRHLDIAAILSKKFNIPIVMSFIDKKDDKYIIEFVDVFNTDDIQKSVDRQAEVTEEYIKAHGIEKWYLFHRRFRPWEKYE